MRSTFAWLSFGYTFASICLIMIFLVIHPSWFQRESIAPGRISPCFCFFRGLRQTEVSLLFGRRSTRSWHACDYFCVFFCFVFWGRGGGCREQVRRAAWDLAGRRRPRAFCHAYYRMHDNRSPSLMTKFGSASFWGSLQNGLAPFWPFGCPCRFLVTPKSDDFCLGLRTEKPEDTPHGERERIISDFKADPIPGEPQSQAQRGRPSDWGRPFWVLGSLGCGFWVADLPFADVNTFYVPLV